jgi:hypothetical protein
MAKATFNLDEGLREKVRQHGINLSYVCRKALSEKVSQEEKETPGNRLSKQVSGAADQSKMEISSGGQRNVISKT